MQENPYFERLCSDVYAYYGRLRNVDPKKHALVMLRSTGEFWSERDVEQAFARRPEGQEFLSFAEFRRLAKSRWYEPENEGASANEDGYGNKIFMHSEDIRAFEAAFDRVSEFYTGNSGPNRTLPTPVLLSVLTSLGEPLPEPAAQYLVSNLHVFNNAVTARSLLCLVGRREPIQRI